MGPLTEWRPFAPLSPLSPLTELPTWNDMLRRLFVDLPAPPTGWQPRVNITETPEAYRVRVEVPGVKPEDVKVTVTEDSLTIQGEKKEEVRTEKDQTRVYECSYGSFLRSFTFPAPVDREAVSAESDNGVLTITVKKGKESRAKQIPIKPANAGAVTAPAKK